MTRSVPGRFTIRSAGVLFLISALFEVFGITHGVPLLGAVRGGAAAVAYHLVYLALFAVVGMGLWHGTAWAPRAVYAATLIYTADKLQAVAFRDLLRRQIQEALGSVPGAAPLLDPDLLVRAAVGVSLLLAAGWWGFALYIYFRRDYFTAARGAERRPPG